MSLWKSRRAVALSIVLVLVATPALAAGVKAGFDLSSPSGGPFPSDRFTVADPSHNTGRRVQLPKPDCGARPSDCADIDVINTLTANYRRGCDLLSGPIDVAAVDSGTSSSSDRDAWAGAAGNVVASKGRLGPARPLHASPTSC